MVTKTMSEQCSEWMTQVRHTDGRTDRQRTVKYINKTSYSSLGLCPSPRGGLRPLDPHPGASLLARSARWADLPPLVWGATPPIPASIRLGLPPKPPPPALRAGNAIPFYPVAIFHAAYLLSGLQLASYPPQSPGDARDLVSKTPGYLAYFPRRRVCFTTGVK